VLDGHERRADPHDHRLGVREQLVLDSFGVAVHRHLDPDLVHRTGVHPGVAQLLQQPVTIRDPSGLDLDVVAHATSIPHRSPGGPAALSAAR
jgi:hypothetical protein